MHAGAAQVHSHRPMVLLLRLGPFLLPLLAHAAAAAGGPTPPPPPAGHRYLLPQPPYRMFSFAYNATAGGPDCKRSGNHFHSYYCDNKTTTIAIPTDVLYPPHTYNLLNPAMCFNTTTPLVNWLNKRGVACMAWRTCWNKKFGKATNDSTVVDYFANVIKSAALKGATAIGMDECGDLFGPHWGHLPGDIPGLKKMSLAAKGLRQGKTLHPNLFVAAWNPGGEAETDGSGKGRGGVFSNLMKDHTFDLAMFETCELLLPCPILKLDLPVVAALLTLR